VATFFVRVQGDSMTGTHIFDGDLLVVDRAEEVRGNHIVQTQIGGETVVKKLRRIDDRLWLCSENPALFLPEPRTRTDLRLSGSRQ
jgi:DNA polymerase V